MKTRNLFGWLAMTAMLVGTGCSTDEVVNDYSPNNAIQFGTYVGRNPESRATVIDLGQLAKEGFGVFAYYTNNGKFDASQSTPNFMYNQKVSGESTTTGEGENEVTTYSTSNWVYEPIKYWPNEATDYLSFFAYAPYDAGGTNSNFTFNQNTGLPTIGFAVDETVKDQKDLLWATPRLDLNKTKDNADINDKVKFEFKHALSRIGFEVQTMINKVNTDKENTSTSTSASNTDSDDTNPNNGTALDSKTTVVVKNVTLTGKFINTGTLSYKEVISNTDSKTYEASITGQAATEDRTYSLSATNTTQTNFRTTTTVEKGTQTDNVYTYSAVGQSVDGTEAQLNAEDSYIMIIPQDFTNNNLTIEVTYDVVTEDSKLPGGVSVVENKISSTFNGVKFEAGKAYNFSLHLGLTTVELEAEVKIWEEGTDYVVNVPLNIADNDN